MGARTAELQDYPKLHNVPELREHRLKGMVVHKQLQRSPPLTWFARIHQVAFALEGKQPLTSFSSSPAWLQQQTAHQISLERLSSIGFARNSKASKGSRAQELDVTAVMKESDANISRLCHLFPTIFPREWLRLSPGSSFFFCTPSFFMCANSLRQLS